MQKGTKQVYKCRALWFQYFQYIILAKSIKVKNKQLHMDQPTRKVKILRLVP